jgi:hypothetical protein
MSKLIYTTYHGPDWMELVEQGWVTYWVNDSGLAVMGQPRNY